MSASETVSYFLVFAVSLLASIAVVMTQRWHGHLSMDLSFGVQKIHTQNTTRIGGVAIALGLAVAWLVAAPAVREILGPMLLAGLPAFAFGLLEDITKKVNVLTRLLATMASGMVAWYLTGVAMRHTGFAPLDWLLAFTPMAVLFTAFAVGGVANAINIIDGFNGLSSGSVAIMLAAMGLISLNVGDAPLAVVCFSIAACAIGFAAVNWPLGKLFLGDGGAYLLGFLLAWLAVLLPMRNPQLNAWTTLLVCAYPVVEVGYSVYRRRSRGKQQPGQPDRLHFHHLIHRRIVRKLWPNTPAALQNGLTSPLCWLMTLVPASLAVAFAQSTPMLVLSFGATLFVYVACYARMSQFCWCFKARTLAPELGTSFP